MKVDTIFKYHFAFEYWTLNTTTNGTEYSKAKDSVGMMLPGQSGGLYLITKEQMQIAMQVRNLRDRSGTVITQVEGVPYPMYIHSAEPQLDPFSNVVAWRHTLRRDIPRNYTSFVEEVIGGA